MSKSRTVRVSTAQSDKLVSDRYEGTHRWEVTYIDPASYMIKELEISCNLGISPKEVLESMGIPFDFGVEIRFV